MPGVSSMHTDEQVADGHMRAHPMFSVLVPLVFSELLGHHTACFSFTSPMPPS